MHRREYWLIGVVAVGLVVAAVLGEHYAPGSELRDPRRSALLTERSGAKGLADVLRRLDVDVVLRRRPLFASADDALRDTSGAMLVLLDVVFAPTGVERRTLQDFVARGNSVLLAGQNGVEQCFGKRVSYLPRADSDVAGEYVAAFDTGRAAAGESNIALPPGIETLPKVWAYLETIPRDSVTYVATGEPDDCAGLLPNAVDTLLSDREGRPVAARLRYGGGGSVILVADSHLLTNESLKQTDAGLLVLPWILAENPSRVIIDEYHQGFQLHSSIFAAAGKWLVRSPIGWVLLQLFAVALAGLSVMAVRFGPALPVVKRKRRSPVEHVDALAAGLERCGGDQAAVSAFVSGLRRRLRGGRGWVRDKDDLDHWLAGLALSVRTPGARGSVARLAEMMKNRGQGDLLEAASTVEDLWEALGHRNRHEQF